MGCMISREELKEVIDLCPDHNSDHLSILLDVLSKREWITERDGKLATALRTPLVSLCAR